MEGRFAAIKEDLIADLREIFESERNRILGKMREIFVKLASENPLSLELVRGRSLARRRRPFQEATRRKGSELKMVPRGRGQNKKKVKKLFEKTMVFFGSRCKQGLLLKIGCKTSKEKKRLKRHYFKQKGQGLSLNMGCKTLKEKKRLKRYYFKQKGKRRKNWTGNLSQYRFWIDKFQLERGRLKICYKDLAG